MENQIICGIDLGGTKIEGILVDVRSLDSPLARIRIPTLPEQGYDAILMRIKMLLEQLEHQTGQHAIGIGIGTPGAIDSRSLRLKNSNTECLNGQNLKSDLEKLLAKPVFLANDANCFALAETILGAASGLEAHERSVVFGAIIGTGVGGGWVLNGKIWNGIHNIAGEWGHNPAESKGPKCYCGRSACLETLISGPALTKYYNQISRRAEPLSLPEIVLNYRSGNDVYAKQTMHRLLEIFGKAIAGLINTIDPGCIVIGGGVSNIDELYSLGPSYISKYIFNDHLNTPLLKPSLSDSAGVFGAAIMAKDGLETACRR